MTKINGVKFNSWSASRLDDYLLCPFMAMHKHLLKTCPACFKGKLKGPFGKPPVCDTCGKARVASPAMERGGEIGRGLEAYIKGESRTLGGVANPVANDLARDLRKKYGSGRVAVEFTINLDRNWKVLGAGWSPEIWLIVKMDVWVASGAKGHVIDWKTGGIDKRTGAIIANEKYDDQLLAYQTAALCAYPKAEQVTAALCFVDAAGQPMIDRPLLKRSGLAKAQAKLTKKALPMFEDDTFSPRPNGRCKWCDFSKGKGGPCPF